MPVEQDSATALANMWPSIDRGLIEDTRSPGAPFPLELLPERWRAWVEACARSSIPFDYVAQASLAAVSAVVGGRFYAEVTAEWYEPLVLWQAMVGGASTGKSPALARAHWLLRHIHIGESQSDEEDEDAEDLAPTILADASVAIAGRAAERDPRGVVLWREELGDWLPLANRPDERGGWFAGWDRGQLGVVRGSARRSSQFQGFAVGLLGTLRPERLETLLGTGDGDDGFAARFLYAWPDATSYATLRAEPPDFAGVTEMLRCVARLPGAANAPGFINFALDAEVRIDELLPELTRRMREARDVEAAWIGKGAGNIVRLASLLALMEWAQQPSDPEPAVEARHVDAAHRLWSSYYLSHAQAVFGRAGASAIDRLARRTVRWLQDNGPPQVSRDQIRGEALRRSVNARGADEVIARLEAGYALRRIVTAKPPRGPAPLRWDVHPDLRCNSGNSGNSGSDSIACVHTI